MAAAKMTIGQLAQQAGVTVETVRYYQRRGLMRRPHRPPSGYRMYSEDDLAALHFIKRAQSLGFALSEVKDLIDLRRSGASPCRTIGCRIEAKLVEVQEKQVQLRLMERQLKALADDCRQQAASPECPLVQRLWAVD